jgi:hypothetical protein
MPKQGWLLAAIRGINSEQLQVAKEQGTKGVEVLLKDETNNRVANVTKAATQDDTNRADIGRSFNSVPGAR